MSRLSNEAARELFAQSKGGKKITADPKFLDNLIKRSNVGVSPAPKVSAPKKDSRPAEGPKKGKYGNIKVPDPEGGPDYDSVLESKHGAEYVQMLKRGEIKALVRQYTFTLHAGIKYKCDFLITHLDGSLEAVDSKGVETDVFKIKKKLLLFDYPGLKFTVRKAKPAKKKVHKVKKGK